MTILAATGLLILVLSVALLVLGMKCMTLYAQRESLKRQCAEKSIKIQALEMHLGELRMELGIKESGRGEVFSQRPPHVHRKH